MLTFTTLKVQTRVRINYLKWPKNTNVICERSYDAYNVCYAEKLSKHSSNILLRLVNFSA